MAKKIVGRVWNPSRKTFQGVIGSEFPDTPGYYEFFVVGSTEHFRKRPDDIHDRTREVSEEIFLALYAQI